MGVKNDDKRKVHGTEDRFPLEQEMFVPTDITIVLSENWSHTPYCLDARSFSVERQAGRQ